MGKKTFRSILDKFNATSADIRASVLMTKDGLALASASPQDRPDPGYDEDRMSALSASILHLGHKFMDDFAGGELDQVLITGKGGCMLAIHGHELALAVLVKPDAEAGLIFSQMERVVDSLRCANPL
jgi:predicted regulator of Ras-like GTPase activity (Roadblock/LC7/MglB family)